MTRVNAEAADQARPVKIVIVEDEPLIRFVMAEALRDQGVCVIEAATADEAWEFLMADSSVDLVFTDMRLPGRMSGADLARRARTEFPGIEIRLTSAYFNPQDWSEPVLRKPYNLYETAISLTATAREAQQRRRPA